MSPRRAGDVAGSPPARPVILAIDTATTRVIVALGDAGGRLGRLATWPAGHRHGETLLPAVERLLGEAGVRPADLEGIVVGTGPGAFTGLRVGLATAKGLGHALGRPIVGVSTGTALIEAAARRERVVPGRVVLLLPAGPSDRVAVRLADGARLLPGGSEPALGRGDRLIAVDLEGRAPRTAVRRGEAAREELPAMLLELGAARLATGEADDLAGLVPDYVTPPRGAPATGGAVTWSPGPR